MPDEQIISRIPVPSNGNISHRKRFGKEARAARLELANNIFRVIASHGRRFFSQDADHRERMENPRISRFEFAENGYLYYIDKYRGSKLFAHYEPQGRGGLNSYKFSEGGTLRCLVQNLRDFILKAWPIMNHFGPWPKSLCGSDLWGYGLESAEQMRAELKPLLAQAEADCRSTAEVLCE